MPPRDFPSHFLHLKDQVGNKLVSTVESPITMVGGVNYETMVFPCDAFGRWSGNELFCDRYATEAEALAGHGNVVADLIEKSPDVPHIRRA